MNITEFLEARIAEDEERAKYVTEYGDTGGIFPPARLLAECAVKREIIDWWINGIVGYVRIDDGELTNPLLPLAAVYKDHPDYQEEWGHGDD
jgi:hypothetical protein